LDASAIDTVVDDSAWVMDQLVMDTDSGGGPDGIVVEGEAKKREKDGQELKLQQEGGDAQSERGDVMVMQELEEGEEAAKTGQPESSMSQSGNATVASAAEGAGASEKSAGVGDAGQAMSQQDREELEDLRSEIPLLKSRIQRMELDRRKMEEALAAREQEMNALKREYKSLHQKALAASEKWKQASQLHSEKEQRLTSQIEHLLAQMEVVRKEAVSVDQLSEVEERLLKERSEKSALKEEYEGKSRDWEREKLSLEEATAQ
jgi:chromosome segregation ATPase